jgi:alkylation response protein AidB-like acyl-CoA dehydrogenase
MSTSVKSPAEQESFAETAMRLSGKTDDEARRMGAVDKADDQVEALFSPQYQTVNSPVHKAVWEKVPLNLFMPPPLPDSALCDAAMNRSLEIARRRLESNTLYDERGKIADEFLKELAPAGYWGMLIEEKYGGQGAPFARFSRFLTRMATINPMVAGLASVHGCIGAVDPVRTFGNGEQKARFLPKLASGESLSGFALTEPCAGSDLTALRTRAVAVDDNMLEITGEKLFITNAIPGRTIGLVLLLEGKSAVVIVELPKEENDQFQVVPYGLYAVRHAYNNGLRFNRLRVPRANLLVPRTGDGLTIGYHGLNLGRLALCANAAGTMRILLTNMLPWSDFRRTYGQAIKTRELVERRIARLAGLIVGADALVSWGSWLIDQGYRGELECIVAKIFGSEALKEAAIDLFMKTHGGRSFLHGHIFGDNLYDFLAPCIYEGEGEMLGMAFFKSLVKDHGMQFFKPIGEALQRKQIRDFNPKNPLHLWALRRELMSYQKWSIGQKFKGRDHQTVQNMDPRLGQHLAFALDCFGRFAGQISNTMQKHQLKLADRQCRIAEMSQRVQDVVVMLTTTLWAHQQRDETSRMAADLLCQDLQRKLTGERPSDNYFRDCTKLADAIIAGGWEVLADAPQDKILMRYDNK